MLQISTSILNAFNIFLNFENVPIFVFSRHFSIFGMKYLSQNARDALKSLHI